MTEPVWDKLRRDRRPRRSVDIVDEPADGEHDDRASTDSVDADARLSDVGLGRQAGSDSAVTQDYEAWAQRLRTHKKEKLGDLGEAVQAEEAQSETSPTEPVSQPSSHWDADALFSGTDLALLEPKEMTNRELLACLGLTEAATDQEIQRTYRRLVKEHHPDRWQHGDPEVRDGHAEHLLDVTAIHDELRERGR